MKLSTVLLVIATLFASVAYAEDMVVIVNPKNPANLSKELVVSYYMGDIKAWIGGLPVKLLDQPAVSPLRMTFNKAVLGKSTEQMKDIWMKNAMSGRAEPPREMDDDTAVKKAVADSRIAMGYIKASSVDDSVRVVLKF